MWDLKSRKSSKTKENRRHGKRRAPDWKRIFHLALRLGVFIGSVVLIGAGGFLAARLVFDSEYFRVDAIEVENNSRICKEEVVALSDIREGTSIFDLDLEMIGGKIEENPWIATASVQRVFPRKVIIRVTEHEPAAVVNLGYLYYMDAEGRIFKVLDGEDSLDFPVVTGIDRSFLLENSAEARRLLKEATTLLGELSTRGTFRLDEVSELNIDPAEGFRLHTYHGGVPVRLGFQGFSGKLDRLEKIYGDLKPRLSALKYIDLNVPDRVIVRVDTGRTGGRG